MSASRLRPHLPFILIATAACGDGLSGRTVSQATMCNAVGDTSGMSGGSACNGGGGCQPGDPCAHPIITASGENPPRETKAEAFDGDSATKWLTFRGTGWIQYELSGGATLVARGYSLTSANDVPGRDPKAWKLLGSSNGSTWTTVDERSDECFSNRFETRTFRAANNTAYAMYRLEISATRTSDIGIIQIAEIGLLEDGSGGIATGTAGNCEPDPVVDQCPNNPNKTEPGLCGCDVDEGACDTLSLSRIDGNELRVGVYNVMRSSVFPKDNGDMGSRRARIEGFARVAKALDVDIWAMQELLYDGADQPGRTPAGVKRHLANITGRSWHMAHDDAYQEFIFSRDPIDASGWPGRRLVWALIDVGNDNNRDNDVVVISVHFVSNAQGTEAAELVSDIIAGRHNQIPRDVNILVVGDFNNKPDEPRHAAMKAAIGSPDIRPVWLGTPDTTFTYGTVYYRNGAFQAPRGGRPIDYIFQRTNSHYSVTKNFILSTLILDQRVLDAHNLERLDVALNPDQSVSEGTGVPCDHLPLVVDLSPNP